MSKYLSQEWLDAFCKLAEDQPSRPGATVSVQYRATGGPDGDIDYYWVFDEGRVLEGKLGVLDGADARITSTYEDTVKIQKGDLDPNAAFMQGKMKVTGNMSKMMSLLPITGSAEWKSLQEKVREITDY